MPDGSEAVADAARKHGLSQGAVQVLWEALVAGRGVQAQFSHPELGGMGQWSGGMVQIGEMFDDALKAKVAAACADLAPLAAKRIADSGPLRPPPNQGIDTWWPAHLGVPSSSGAQNETRYACFLDQRRLAVERDGIVTLYDTGEHRISGFSQQQSTCSAMAFASQTGPVMLEGLRVVDR